mgnify:CR=1|jgi:hypothetical protein
MKEKIKYLKDHRALYFAIGSTLAMFLYIKFILGHVSTCFINSYLFYNSHWHNNYIKNIYNKA